MGRGVMPNVFTILNSLYMKVQDYKTQEVIDELQLKEIPPHRLEEVTYMEEILEHLSSSFLFLEGAISMVNDSSAGDAKKENVQLHLNSFWRS